MLRFYSFTIFVIFFILSAPKRISRGQNPWPTWAVKGERFWCGKIGSIALSNSTTKSVWFSWLPRADHPACGARRRSASSLVPYLPGERVRCRIIIWGHPCTSLTCGLDFSNQMNLFANLLSLPLLSPHAPPASFLEILNPSMARPAASLFSLSS